MLKDKFCKLENRILGGRSGKMPWDFIMKVRRGVSRICPIQSLVSI